MASFADSANVFLSSSYLDKQFIPNPTTQRGAGVHLNFNPKNHSQIIYPSGRNIIVKDLKNSKNNFVYRGHNAATTVAKFSPSGMFVASADSTGKVRVWSWTHKEKLIKLDTQVFAGAVRDLDWDFENKKIVAVGEGQGMMAKVFMWDTGNSTGEMVGHNKPVLSVSYKPSRPFRIMSVSEDFRSLFYAGPPFKLEHSENCHTNFVNCVRYSPDGSRIASVGSDKRIQFYDGKTGEPQNHIVDAHSASIYSVSWSPDGSRIVTASSDKSLKVWNVATDGEGNCVKTFNCGDVNFLAYQIVGCVWTSSNLIVALTLDGTLWHVDMNNASDMDSLTLTAAHAHQGAITASAILPDNDKTVIVTGSFDGVVVKTDVISMEEEVTKQYSSGDKRSVCNALHKGFVAGVAVVDGCIISTGWDNIVRSTNIESGTEVKTISLLNQPKALVATTTGIVAMVTSKELRVFQSSNLDEISTITTTYQPTCISITNIDGDDQLEIAVGGSDNVTHMYSLDVNGQTVTEAGTLPTPTSKPVSAITYSTDGCVLAVGDAGRQIEIFKRNTTKDIFEVVAEIRGQWVFHTSKVTALSFSPSGDRLASGGVDESIFIWRISAPRARVQIPYAHNTGVATISWIGEEQVVSTGSDGCIVQWKIAEDAA